MANSATNALMVTFQQAAGIQQIDAPALVAQLEALRSVSETQVDAIGSNTEAVTQNTSSRGVGDTAKNVASSLAKNALSMLPLVGMFSQLFGGGGETEQAAPLTKYTAPTPIQFDGSTTVTYAAPPSTSTTASSPSAAAAPASSAAPQVTIQVQAMDSRSFMDHSHEIAQAVREAMLNMHPLNDVVSDL